MTRIVTYMHVILPPLPVSSVTASIAVDSARDGEFRVQCSSTGGRALNMTVTGCGIVNANLTDNIQPVGTPARIGDDEYSATTSDIVTGGNDRDIYQCTATGSTSNTGTVHLRGEENHTSLNLIITSVSHQLLILQSLSHWRELQLVR